MLKEAILIVLGVILFCTAGVMALMFLGASALQATIVISMFSLVLSTPLGQILAYRWYNKGWYK